MIKFILGIAALLALISPAAAQTCEASQYGVGDRYQGSQTASGPRFNTYAKGTEKDPYTVAMLPPQKLNTYITITNLANGLSIRAKVTDRGPHHRGRCVDLGRSGANALRMGGTARVEVR